MDSCNIFIGFGAVHPPVYPRITGTCTQNECAETAMGRQGWIGAVQVSAQHIKSTHPHQPTPHPTQELGPISGKIKKTQGPTTAQGPPQGMHTGTRDPTAPDQATPRGKRVNLSPLDVGRTDAH